MCMRYPIWDGVYKKSLATNQKVEAADFISRCHQSVLYICMYIVFQYPVHFNHL